MRNHNVIKVLFTISTLFLLSCTPTIKNFQSYNEVPFSRSAFLDENSKNGCKKKKVVIFKSDHYGVALDKGDAIGSIIIKKVENTLEENKLVEFIDRKTAKKLEEEIKLIEMNQSGAYKGPQIADYAIIIEVSNASFDSHYISGYQPNAANLMIDTAIIAAAANSSGNSTTTIHHDYTSPKFEMTAKVEGNIKIYELPSLKVVKIIPFTRTRTKTKDAVIEKEGFLGLNQTVNIEELNKIDMQLISETSSASIDKKVKKELKQFFTQIGYIIEKRELKKGKKSKYIFKIDLGSIDGIQTKQKLNIINRERDYNPITQEEFINYIIMGKAVVSDRVFDNSSWIIVKDEEIIDKIKLGNIVKVLYK